ncbi:MAG: hypothetical protein PHC93_04600 [Candidatus Omnitrophica bacterium]|nr:hypothetical protein [Candidatus Omnitrophota bacterium]
MIEQLINFETAKLAKEKGFNELCNNNVWRENEYSESIGKNDEYTTIRCSAPTQSLLQKWLRDKHNIHINIHYTFGAVESYIAIVNREVIRDPELKELGVIGERSEVMLDHKLFDKYEEALEKSLQEGLKLIK